MTIRRIPQVVYDEWVSAIGQGIFTGLCTFFAIGLIGFGIYKLFSFGWKKISPLIRAKLKSRKIGKDENGNDGDKPKKDD